MTTIAQIDVKTLLRLDLGIDKVNNWDAVSTVNDASTTKYATAAAVKTTYDYAATKVPIALRTNWATIGILDKVIGQLAWQKNGNNSTIFDASNALSPNGGAVGNTNAAVAWAAGSPVLMGWNGTSTYGVRVDSARSADVLNNSRVSATSKILTINSKNALSGNSDTQLVINPAAAWSYLLVDSPLTVNGALDLGAAADGTKRGISGVVGTTDYWFVGGGSTAADAGYLEMATGDNGTEPIYARQYSGNPVSGGTITRTATLLDGSGNTAFPVQVTSPKFYADNWFHSTGATGWVNDTYAGGIYMTDTTWLRIYNGKKFYVSNTEADSIYTAGGVKSMLKMAVDGAAWLAANTTHTAAALRQVSSPFSVDFGAVSGTDDYYPIIDGRSIATTYGYDSRVALGMYRSGGGKFSQAALVVGSAESANTTYFSYTFDAYGKATAATFNATGSATGQGLAYNGKSAIGGTDDSWLRLNPNSDFTSGIYANSVLRDDAGFMVGAAGAYLLIDSTGKFTSNAEVISKSANSFRSVSGNYGAFWRNDGTGLYLMLTASGDQYGTYNALRPFTVDLATGAVSINNGLTATLTGNASTATKLATARTINAVSFDGSANIVIEPYIEQDLSTAANRFITFVDSSTAGHQRLNLDDTLTYNPSTNLIGASISGNAGTATVLQTARTINGVSFNGSANITITDGTTQAKGNNSTKLATTSFVQNVGHRFYGSGVGVDASMTIAAGNSEGGWYEIHTNQAVVTLPSVASVLTGTTYTFRGWTYGGTIKGSGTENICLSNGAIVNAYLVKAGETITVVNNGSAWYVVAAGALSAALSAATNGYCTLAGGIILQWGMTAYGDFSDYNAIAVTFPIVFPESSPYSFVCTQDTVQYATSVSINSLSASGITAVVKEYDGTVTTGYIRWMAIGK